MKAMSQSEFAAHMGVNKSTVSRWISNGRITLMESGKIDPDSAASSLRATESPEPHHQARIEQIAAEKAARAAQGQKIQDAMPGAERLGLALKHETFKLRKADAEIREMERAKIAGTLGETERFEFVIADIGLTLRNILQSLPDRLAPVLSAHRGDVSSIHSTLVDTTHDLLNEISDHMRRKSQEIAK